MPPRKSAPPAEAVEFAMIPLAKITPSAANPRKVIDPDELAKLAASIEVKGVLQPVLVRPHACGDGTYELVAGERRWRASKLAGKDTIPAVVRALSDKEAAEARVIENNNREDLPPLDEAQGFQDLLAFGDDAAGVALRIGRSESYVLDRLQLLKLIPALQDDLAKGYITLKHARLLGRIERPEDQAELRAQNLYDWPHPDNTKLLKDGHVVRANSVEGVRRSIETHYRRDLSAAPWDLADADLVPAAGACTACVKRSGGRPGLFDELSNGDGRKKRDHCFDRTCFDGKKEALIQLGVKKAEAAGAPAAEVLRVSTEAFSRDEGVLSALRYERVSPKQAKAAKPSELRQAVIADGADVGKVVTVKVKKESRASARAASDPYARQNRERMQKAELGRQASLAANGLVAERVAKAFAGVELPPAAAKHVRQLALVLPDIVWSDASRLVCKRRGLKQKHSADREAVEELADGLATPAELLGLVFELVAARRSFDWGREYYSGAQSAADKEFWSAFGVDRTKLLKAAAAEKGKAKAAKTGAKKKAKTAAK